MVRAGRRYVSLLQSFHNGSGAHSVSCSVGFAVFFPEVKANHSHPSSAEVKKGGTEVPFPTVFMSCTETTSLYGIHFPALYNK
jgi:hypothetical protein